MTDRGERLAPFGKPRAVTIGVLTRIRDAARDETLDRLCTILAVAGIALLGLRRWILIGPYPPGLDGAQWLALGRGLLGYGRSTDGAYAPLGPILATIGESMAGPLDAIRLLAALSGLAVSLTVWLVARDLLGPVWGLIATAIVIPASALVEPALFGGYPQLLALAAGLLALWASCRYLATGDRGGLWQAGVAGFAAAGAHHVYFPVFTLSILVAIGFWLSGETPTNRLERIRALALAFVPAFTLFVAVAFTFVRAGYAAPLDASARSFARGWEYGTRESPVLWLGILVTGVTSLAFLWQTRGSLGWLLAASLLLPSGLLFVISGQPRLLPPIIVGAGLAAGFGARRIAALGLPARAVTLLVAVLLAATLVFPADRAASRFADFYQVVDKSLVDAAAAIEVDGASGMVAVRQDRRGWPIGWWFEALLQRPVIVGADPRWLAFPDEWEHARQADALFDGGLDASAFRQLVDSADVRYLVVAKWDWIGWERWTSTPGFPVSVLYDDDRYLVLRVT